MSDVERLLEEYIAGHKAGREADPREYLRRLEGADRSELAALIDGYLKRAARREWDAAAFERSDMAPFVDSLARSLEGSSGLWPSVLPRSRERARIKRSELVAELAERLGAAGQREKVARYYHHMEQGLLPAAGVSDRVLEALANILGESKEALQRAGQAFGAGPESRAADEAAFARRAWAPEGEPGIADAAPPAPPAEDEWDEVDRLFRGG